MSAKTIVLLSFTLLLTSTPALAEKSATRPGEIRKEILQEIREEKRLVIKNTRASLKQAKLLTKTDSVLTVEKDGQTYTINISDKTQLRRRFWGKATLSEFTVGDLLDIQGKWTDNTKTIINATLVRDTSVQKRFGTFFGTVKSVSGNTIVIESEKRETQTITATSSAKIINRKQQKISLSDILVGHKIRVKGLWNNLNNTITEVKEIKDFTLPEKSSTPSATPKP